jgi:hypothetical protein
MLLRIALLLSACLLTSLPGVRAEEPVDLDVINKIRYEGLKRSEVMDTVKYLSDVIGARLTGAPAMMQANEWTRDNFIEWGVEDATIEPWGEFGRGWSYASVAVDLLSPRQTTLFAIPRAWTPGTDGPVEGEVMKVTLNAKSDFKKYKGKLAGKILLMDKARPLPANLNLNNSNNMMRNQYTSNVFAPEKSGGNRGNRTKRHKFRKALREFLAEEEALAAIYISGFNYGIIEARFDTSYGVGDATLPPSVYMASNYYNQLYRLVSDDHDVRLRINIDAQFHEEDTIAYNTVAEIPGHGPKKDELVLLGAHLDTTHAGTGATDDGASCAVVMEAMRILKAIDARPRRTVRAVLWSGEEEGLLGSRGYVKNHFASRPETTDPDELELPPYFRERLWPITPLPDHKNVSAYFNLDNGGGKILGIYAEDNAAAVPIFEAWLKPFHDIGAKDILLRHTGGTDHLAFDEVGLPGFQFIQNMRDYMTRTHHTNLDDVDYVRREELMQAAVVMASFVYHAAMRDEKFPRKPIPQKPRTTDDGDEEEAAAAKHVVHISVDGLRGDFLKAKVNEEPDTYPNFRRFVDEGATTFNARTDFTHTVTLPNHTAMLTARPVLRPKGAPKTVYHGYTANDDPTDTSTLHNSGNKNVDYIPSVFDVAHDAGLTTALYASKTKFIIYEQSYNAKNGAPDITGADHGTDKIDYTVIENKGEPLTARFVKDFKKHKFDYAFVHDRRPDHGHVVTWGTEEWFGLVQEVDGFLGDLFEAIESDPDLNGNTAIVLTADHGGYDEDHGDSSDFRAYTIPVLVWGAGIAEGADLYELNDGPFANPGEGRPDFTTPAPPIRNGNTGNLSLNLLGLDAIKGTQKYFKKMKVSSEEE